MKKMFFNNKLILKTIKATIHLILTSAAFEFDLDSYPPHSTHFLKHPLLIAVVNITENKIY